MFKKIATCALIASIGLIGSSARAAENTGYRKIIYVGCHHFNNICFIQLEGSPFGGSLGCASGPTNEFRIDNADTVIGRRTYSTLLAAHLSGRTVAVQLDGCSSQGGPALLWFHVGNQ
jgi:hypothetical protein